jgi:hypothetical protein
MGRRRFLGALAGLGMSGAGLQYVTKEALADLDYDPDEEVPRLDRLRHSNHDAVANGDEPPKYEPYYYTISRDKWARVETADDAMQRVSGLLDRIEDTPLLQATVQTVTRGQHSRRGVVVQYVERETRDGRTATPNVDYRTVADALPATVTGRAGDGEYSAVDEEVPVEVRRQTRTRYDGHSGGLTDSTYYDYAYDPVPGGAMLTWQEDDGTLHRFTSATPMFDNDRGYTVLTTVGHGFEGNSGELAEQPGDGYGIGYSDKVKNSSTIDAATIDPYAFPYSTDLTYRFAGDDGNYADPPIVGKISWSRIKDEAGNSNYATDFRGITTGEATTYIRAYSSNKDVVFEKTADHGDSGGPMHRLEYNSSFELEAYMIAHVEGGGDVDGDGDLETIGPYTGKVENELNLSL